MKGVRVEKFSIIMENVYIQEYINLSVLELYILCWCNVCQFLSILIFIKSFKGLVVIKYIKILILQSLIFYFIDNKIGVEICDLFKVIKLMCN